MDSLDATARQIADIALRRFHEEDRRVLIAVAGPPGSGKSTLAQSAVDVLAAQGYASAEVFAMDGYHCDDSVLEAVGRRTFKGAIDTFDADGLRHMLMRLKANTDDVIAVPVFDRAIEIARAAGRLIPRSVGIIICEGNYLLARQAPWDQLKPIFDFTIFVDVDENELRHRLRERWQSFGLSDDEIHRKVEENDLPNGLAIISGSAEPDLRVSN